MNSINNKLKLSSKTFGGCSKCYNAVAKGLIVVIVIFVVVCVAIAVFSNNTNSNYNGIQSNLTSNTGYGTTFRNDGIRRNGLSLLGSQPNQDSETQRDVRETNESLIPKQEGFITNMSRLYTGLPNPLMPNTKKVIKDFNENNKANDLYNSMKSSYLGGVIPNKASRDVYKTIENGDEPTMLEVNKASESGINNGAQRKMNGDQYKGKLNVLRSTVERSKPMEPVKGLANGNSRFNNLSLGSITIDDRGEGVNLGVSNPIETFGPTIATNSRLAGSSMNITPLTGACFKKYNTDDFFENNTPLPPILNVAEGKPKTLKYNTNNTM